MERVFEIRTETHRAKIGSTTLYFIPEVAGSAFVAAYTALVDAQKTATGPGDSVDVAGLEALNTAMDEFLTSFMLADSVAEYAALTLPDRIKFQLIEWVASLYGGGSGNPDAAGGTSSG